MMTYRLHCHLCDKWYEDVPESAIAKKEGPHLAERKVNGALEQTWRYYECPVCGTWIAVWEEN